MSEDRERRIRERAHALWEQAGRPRGRHDEHWRQASQEIGEEGSGQQGEPSGPAEPSLKGLEPAAGESLEEITKGEHQGP
jgi:hypothetical protein